MADSSTIKQHLLALQSNLYNFACQLTSDREAAHDLLQDTTLKVLDNEDRYVDKANFKGWVFTIMRNIFINNYRRQTRNATLVDSTEDNVAVAGLVAESGVETPEGTYAVREITDMIRSFASAYRVPFTMFVAGYRYSEIAAKMGLPLGTVKSRIFFTRKRLQSILRDYRD